jgi:hypothetical protein
VGHSKDHSQTCPAHAGHLVVSDGRPWDAVWHAASCREVGGARHRGPASALDLEAQMDDTDRMRTAVIICVGLRGRNAARRLNVGVEVVFPGEGVDEIEGSRLHPMSSDPRACA